MAGQHLHDVGRAVSFPASVLGQKAELNLGGSWTDITPYVLVGQGGSVQVQRGHPDESTQTPASQSGLTLANTDFRFVSLNPTGPYYPDLGRNTPLRWSLPGQSAALRIEDDTTSFAAMPGNGVLPFTTMDIRLDLALSGWSPCTLASWWGGSGHRAWLLALNGDGTLTLSWTSDGTLGTLASVTSTQPVPLVAGCLRVTFAPLLGTITFYTGAAGGIAGSTWTQLGAAVTVAATAVFVGTASFGIGYNSAADNDFDGLPGLTGRVADALVMSGIGGTIVAQAAFSSQAAGATTWTDAESNVWTLGGSATLDNRSYRYHGEAAGWPQRWDPTAHDINVDVSVSGMIRRLGQRQKTTASPVNRAVSQLDLAAYWPAEDGPNSTQLATGIAGGQPMSIGGTAKLANDSSSFPGSSALPDIESARLTGGVTSYTATNVVVARFLMNPSATLTGLGAADVIRIDTTGTAGSVYVTWFAMGDGLQLSSSALGLLVLSVPVTAGVPVVVSVELVQSGGNVTPTLAVMTADGTVTSDSAAAYAGTAGAAKAVQVNPDPVGMGDTAIGHVFVQTSFTPLSGLADAVAAHAGEAAGTRFARVCAENGIRSRIWGWPEVSQPMGPQPASTFLAVLQECVDADRGIMYEPSECLGLGMRTTASMVNQAPALTIGYAQLMADLGETEDDQITANYITATNTDGSSATQSLDTGVMGTAEPPGGAGIMDQQVSVNLAEDSQLPDRAGWELNLGTVNQPRYPAVRIDLATFDATIQALWWQVLGLRIGDRIVVTSPPGMLPPGNIDQIMQGPAENFWDKKLNFAFACSPSLPYFTGIFDDPAYGRGDTDGSQLHAGIGTSDTSFLVDTTGASGLVWTYNSVLFLANGTFAPVRGLASVTGQGWAGGGGGGGSGSSTAKGGGGAGGEYAADTVPVTPGKSYPVTVGAAGTSSASATGGTGGNTTIAGDSVTVTAHGGTGGGAAGSAGTGGTGSTNTTHHDGGAGGTSPSSGDGGGSGGGSGGTSSPGNAGTNATSAAATPGAIAVTGGGPGGNGGAHSLPGSAPASGPGGGGGGAGGNTGGPSGAGDPGQALISWSNADFPFEIVMGGEVMTVSAVQGATSPQLFTISARAVNGVSKSHSAGEAVQLYPTPIFAWM